MKTHLNRHVAPPLAFIALLAISTATGAQAVQYDITLTPTNYGGPVANAGHGSFTVNGPIPEIGSATFVTTSFSGSVGAFHFSNATPNAHCEQGPIGTGMPPYWLHAVYTPGNPAYATFMDGVPTGISYSVNALSSCGYGPPQGVFQSISGTQFTFYRNTDSVSGTITFAVPEPATYLLMLGGLAGIVMMRRRKRA
jgi:hypothetical protein